MPVASVDHVALPAHRVRELIEFYGALGFDTPTIREVENSLELQDLAMTAEQKAVLIVQLYKITERDGFLPSTVTIDRLAWLG